MTALEMVDADISQVVVIEDDPGASLLMTRILHAYGVRDVYQAGDGRSGINLVRIIHGKGTGVLRGEIDSLLKGHPLVKRHRLGNWNEGDTGVTIVELA